MNVHRLAHLEKGGSYTLSQVTFPSLTPWIKQRCNLSIEWVWVRKPAQRNVLVSPKHAVGGSDAPWSSHHLHHRDPTCVFSCSVHIPMRRSSVCVLCTRVCTLQGAATGGGQQVTLVLHGHNPQKLSVLKPYPVRKQEPLKPFLSQTQ